MNWHEYYKQQDYLEHHGILGQKWGVRRFQNADGSLTSAGKSRYGGKEISVEGTGGHRLNYESPASRMSKYVAKSLALSAASSLIPGFAYAYNAIAIGKDFAYYNDKTDYTKKEGAYEKVKDLRKKDKSSSIEEDMKLINPHKNRKGGVVNCVNCTVSMEMRRRGYDVQARMSNNGHNISELAGWFKNPKIESIRLDDSEKVFSSKDKILKSYDNLCSTIEKTQGNGARGYISVRFPDAGMGHAMFYEVSNNRVHFYDTQSGKGEKFTDKVFSRADPDSYKVCRLDNLELNDGVTETCVSRKDK